LLQCNNKPLNFIGGVVCRDANPQLRCLPLNNGKEDYRSEIPFVDELLTGLDGGSLVSDHDHADWAEWQWLPDELVEECHSISERSLQALNSPIMMQLHDGSARM
jgi:hypothetical protein